MYSSAEQYMQRALDLSLKGLGNTLTNPLVGCVIVYENRIIGEGYHTKYGAAHAEVEAMQSVSENDRQFLSQSTLYVTLEPCCHFGKTPPCTDLIIENKIPHVVVAQLDPYEKVSGKGVERLKSAGVLVEVGVLQHQAAFANRRFLCNQTLKRPYIILKWAETIDGFIAGKSNGQKQISGSMAQLLVHRWRSEESAFLIGKNTLLNDSPLLNNRFWTGANPTRVVLGNADESYYNLPFFDLNIPTYLIGNKHKIGHIKNAELVEIETGNLGHVLEFLMQQGMSSVVVEGGRSVLDNFLQFGFWDEVRVLQSKNKYFNNGLQAPCLPEGNWENEDLSDDTLKILYKNVI